MHRISNSIRNEHFSWHPHRPHKPASLHAEWSSLDSQYCTYFDIRKHHAMKEIYWFVPSKMSNPRSRGRHNQVKHNLLCEDPAEAHAETPTRHRVTVPQSAIFTLFQSRMRRLGFREIATEKWARGSCVASRITSLQKLMRGGSSNEPCNLYIINY